MGKQGKARKRQKIENGISHLEYDISSDTELNDTSIPNKNCIDTAISVITCLGQRLEVFDRKALKKLRIELFPLIKVQENKYFEVLPSIVQLEDSILDQIIIPKFIDETIRCAKYFKSHLSEFAEEKHKEFRRALHPLVIYTFSKQGKIQSNVKLNPDNVAKINDLLPNISLINRISQCFRLRDFSGALLGLNELVKALNGSSKPPKLGCLQRWVRECDISGSNTADVASHNDLSLLLLHAVLRVIMFCTNKRIDKNNQLLSSSVSCSSSVYPYYKVVKLKYPPFTVAPVYAVGSYFTTDAMYQIISTATTDSETFLSKQKQTNKDNHNICNTDIGKGDFYSRVHVVSHVAGSQRRPPSEHDLNIYATEPFTIQYYDQFNQMNFPYKTETKAVENDDIILCSDNKYSYNLLYDHCTCSNIMNILPTVIPAPNPCRYDVVGVPGAFLLTGILTPLECCQFIVAAEKIGYSPDAVDGIDNIVWLADESLLGPIYSRVQSLLPAFMEDDDGADTSDNKNNDDDDGDKDVRSCALAGLNARLRLFRYYSGAEYRPHIDGAWPGSGMIPVDDDEEEEEKETKKDDAQQQYYTYNKDGRPLRYTDDAFSGDRHSRLTFLIYLNDDFSGGETTFFLPANNEGGEQNEFIRQPNNEQEQKTTVPVDNKNNIVDATIGKDGQQQQQLEGSIEVRAVRPQLGAVLVFPHGSAMGSLVHEGSAVVKDSGVKYVIRTDVLYMTNSSNSNNNKNKNSNNKNNDS